MKKIFLTLSLAFTGVIIGACASNAGPFPAGYIYVADTTNDICAKYKIIDLEKLLVQEAGETTLNAGGECDRMVGFSRADYPKVKNWIVQSVRDGKEQVNNLLQEIDRLQHAQ